MTISHARAYGMRHATHAQIIQECNKQLPHYIFSLAFRPGNGTPSVGARGLTELLRRRPKRQELQRRGLHELRDLASQGKREGTAGRRMDGVPRNNPDSRGVLCTSALTSQSSDFESTGLVYLTLDAVTPIRLIMGSPTRPVARPQEIR